MSCNEFEESLSLFLYDELGEEDRDSLEAHVAGCAACGARLAEMRRLHELLARRPTPEATQALLAQCRRAFKEALDREIDSVSWRSIFKRWFEGSGRPIPSGVALALSLLVLGFGLGWTLRPRAGQVFPPLSDLGPVGADLGNLRINNISQVSPSPEGGEVRVTVDAEKHITLEGSLDDPRIRQILVSAVKSYDNAGVRHDSLDALRSKPDDPSVRDALLYSMQNDSNVGVQLDALDVVRRLGWSPEIRRAFLNTLERDKNPGVRVAAIDALVQHADTSVLPTLERLATSDPNSYVRLKSLTAVRKLGGGQF